MTPRLRFQLKADDVEPLQRRGVQIVGSTVDVELFPNTQTPWLLLIKTVVVSVWCFFGVPMCS